MTLTLFWGCVFCAFGAATVLFVRVVATKAQLMIVGISSAFFWLLALTAASILWFVISPLKGCARLRACSLSRAGR
jgi:anterior pharynx defective protein 1